MVVSLLELHEYFYEIKLFLLLLKDTYAPAPPLNENGAFFARNIFLKLSTFFWFLWSVYSMVQAYLIYSQWRTTAWRYFCELKYRLKSPLIHTVYIEHELVNKIRRQLRKPGKPLFFNEKLLEKRRISDLIIHFHVYLQSCIILYNFPSFIFCRRQRFWQERFFSFYIARTV